MGLAVNGPGVASSSRGLVGDTVFAVLPNIQPVHTFAVTLAVQLVSDCPSLHFATVSNTFQKFTIDHPDETVVFTNVQILFKGFDPLWICFFSFWVACP